MQQRRKTTRATRLSFIDKGITSIRDVTQEFHPASLTSLNVHANTIAAFDGLSRLTTLTELNLSANSLGSLRHFPTLPLLHTLNLANNGLTSCNGLPFSPRLSTLILTHNRICTVQQLSDFKRGELTHLDLRGNPIDTATALTQLKTVTSLQIVKCDEVSRQISYTPEQDTQIDDTHALRSTHTTIDARKTDRCTEATSTSREFDRVVMGYPAPPASETKAIKDRAECVLVDARSDTDPPTEAVVVTSDRATLISGDDKKQWVRSTGSQAELPTREEIVLKKTVTDLQDRLQDLEGEMVKREQKYQAIELEFLEKIQSLKETSAKELQNQAKTSQQRSREQEMELAKRNAQLAEIGSEIKSVQALSKKLHSDIEKKKEKNEALCRQRDEDRREGWERQTRLENELRSLEKQSEKKASELMASLSTAEKRLSEAQSTVSNLEKALSDSTRKITELQNQTVNQTESFQGQLNDLQAKLTVADNRLSKAQVSEASLRNDAARELEALSVEREGHQKRVSEIEREFELRLQKSSEAAFGEGEAHGKTVIDAKLREEAQRLRTSFTAIEETFRKEQKASEKRNVHITTQLEGREKEIEELKTALLIGRQSSYRQEKLMKEMHRVIEHQKQTIQSLKDGVRQLTDKLDTFDVARVASLVEEVRGGRKEIVRVKNQLAASEETLFQTQETLRNLKVASTERLGDAERDRAAAQNETRRLRTTNAELKYISEIVSHEKEKLSDAVKVKETMLDDANETIADLKEELHDAENETTGLRQALLESEREVSKLQTELTETRETVSREMKKSNMALEQKIEKVRQLEKKLERKTELISAIESEIIECKTRFNERILKTENVKTESEKKIQEAENTEENLKSVIEKLEIDLAEEKNLRQTEAIQIQSVQETITKLREENRNLSQKASTAETDMYRLMASVDRERQKSNQKVQQLGKILSDLRTPLLKTT